MMVFLPSCRVLAAAFLVLIAGAAAGQAPTVVQVLPAAHAGAVPGTSSVSATLNQPLNAASAGALKVFSSQRGGLRSAGGSGTVTVNNNTLTFAPTYGFRPGETVQVTLTTAAQSTSGAALAAPRVWEFTASVGGTGQGTFTTPPPVVVRPQPSVVAMGDVDNDGDLDLVTLHSDASAVVRFNSGRGTFTNGGQLSVFSSPVVAKLADVDGDGDLDLLALVGSSSRVSVRLNDGLGTFSGTQEVSVGYNTTDLAVGDVDGDGDLDLATCSDDNLFVDPTVCVRLNNGSGVFGGISSLDLVDYASAVALADFDNDGDLDLVLCQNASTRVHVYRNNGRGNFPRMPVVLSGVFFGGSMAVGDVDHDGYADLVLGQFRGTNIYVVHNAGGTAITTTQTLNVGAASSPVRLADLDGDGDLDILAAVRSTGTAAIFFNDGSGTFGMASTVTGLPNISDLAVGDLDADGDLDFAAPNYGQPGLNVNIRLNNGTGPAATAPGAAPAGFALSPNPATTAFALTGLRLGTPVQVLDALGREVLALPLPASGTVALPAGLRAGLYVVRAGGAVRQLAVE